MCISGVKRDGLIACPGVWGPRPPGSIHAVCLRRMNTRQFLCGLWRTLFHAQKGIFADGVGACACALHGSYASNGRSKVILDTKVRTSFKAVKLVPNQCQRKTHQQCECDPYQNGRIHLGLISSQKCKIRQNGIEAVNVNVTHLQ